MNIDRMTRSRGRAVAIVAGLALLVVALGVAAAMANHVDPVTVGPQANPTCPEGLTGFKIEQGDFGNGEHGDGTLSVTISNFDGSTATFDWSSNIGVDQVIVKGGDFANIYTYDPEETSDTGLHTPFNENSGQNYGLSHVTFCYDVEGSPTPTPTPTETTPTPTPTGTETTPGVTVSPTTVETSPSVLGTKILGQTGSSVLQLLFVALAFLALGLGAFVIASRAQKNAR